MEAIMENLIKLESAVVAGDVVSAQGLLAAAEREVMLMQRAQRRDAVRRLERCTAALAGRC